jgi:hypothetical protein
MKVYGPYLRKDGRKHVIIIYDDKTRRTVSYPKYLMEQKLKRELRDFNITVHHDDENFKNNKSSNLKLMTRKKHATLDAVTVDKIEIICAWCKKKAYKKAGSLTHNSKMGKAGPFCSHSCSGKYSSSVQYGKTKRLPVQPSYPKEKRVYRRNGKLIK